MRTRPTYGDRMGDGRLLTRTQEDVLKILRVAGPCDDTALVACYQKNVGEGKVMRQTASSIRTRRAELVEGGLAYDTDRREKLPSGRTAAIWDAV